MATKTFVDPLLSGLAKGYRPLRHMNLDIMPFVGVKKQAGKIGSYGADNLRIVTAFKGDDAETAVLKMTESIGTGWLLEEHALKAFASDKQAENEDAPFNVMRDRTELVMDVLSGGREFALASFMGTAANFTNKVTLAGADQWGGGTDDPIDDLETAINTCADAIGVDPAMLSLVIPRQVWRKLIKLPEILATLGFANRDIPVPSAIMPEQIATAFGLKKVIIPSAFYNSAAEGKTDVLASTWGKHAWIVHIPDGQGIKIQPFGYTFGRRQGPVVDRWYDADRKGWWVRATDEFDQVVLNEKAAYMIVNAIA